MVMMRRVMTLAAARALPRPPAGRKAAVRSTWCPNLRVADRSRFLCAGERRKRNPREGQTLRVRSPTAAHSA